MSRCFMRARQLRCLLVGLVWMVATDAARLRDIVRKTQEVGSIIGFRLIDADTGLPISDIKDDQVLNLDLQKATHFNIDVTTQGQVGSVVFGYLRNGNYTVESRPPFSLCGDNWRTGDYLHCKNFPAGSHVVSATPYSESKLGGKKGTTMKRRFTIVIDQSLSAPTLKPQSRAPRKPPTTLPIRSPISVPQTKTPSYRPSSAPKRPPSSAPLKSPTKFPKQAPASSPATIRCATPKFLDESWQIAGPQFPLRSGEPQGLLIGNDLVIFSGFINLYANVTNQTYARDVTVSNSVWRRMDDMPISTGITHAATVVIGTKVYLCGGYMGGHPGPHVPYCFVYDNAIQPGQQQQWAKFADIPGGGSAGGGMIYDAASNTLFFAGGGQRRKVGSAHPVDISNSWKFKLSLPGSGWVASTPIPYLANHISYVTHTDVQGKQRHFFLGGQVGEYECCTNFGLNYEFVASTETWIKRASIPLPRGHASASTRAIGCGFVIAGGAIDSGGTGKARTNDISYYDIPTDTWTAGIGTLPKESATPIIDIHSDGYMYYVTSLPNQSRRRISV